MFKYSYNKQAFTLVELIIAFSIFLIVMGLVLSAVTGVFRSQRRMQVVLDKEQRQRMCLLRLSREVSSLMRIVYPRNSFKGAPQEFFFIFAREDNLMESSYAFNPSKGTLEHSSQESPDYDWSTYQNREICLDGLSECSFSYSDGVTWFSSWEENKEELPRAIKIIFKFTGDTQEREFVVRVPVSQ